MDDSSSNALSLEVVNLSQRIPRSSHYRRQGIRWGSKRRYLNLTHGEKKKSSEEIQDSDINKIQHVDGTYIYSVTIICNLEELQTAILDQDFHRGGSSIDRIFDEFFQCMHGSHDDLSGSDLVDHIWIKSLLRAERVVSIFDTSRNSL